jgi:nuclear factor 4
MLSEEDDIAGMQPTTKNDDEVNCVICNALCSGGYHFHAQTCPACAAFFRRTVTERREYDCMKSPACQIEHGGKIIKIIT